MEDGRWKMEDGERINHFFALQKTQPSNFYLLTSNAAEWQR